MMPVHPTGTGVKAEAIQHYKAEPPKQVKGEHLWIIAGMWRVNPVRCASQQVHLDMENLLTLDGPGCFWCEEPWEPGMERLPCRGRPRHA